MPSTFFLTKAPAHALLMAAQEASAKVTPYSLNSPTFRHRAVMGLFPSFDDNNPRSHADILFRLDTPAGQAPYFLIQSAVAPTITGFPEIITKEIALDPPAPSTPVSFRLSVNAIRRESFTNASGKRAYKVRPVPADHELTEIPTLTPWLAQKLAPALTDIEITNHRRTVLKDPRQQGRMTLQIDDIDGVALAGESESLHSFLATGVGREKAYGCGLLSIRALA